MVRKQFFSGKEDENPHTHLNKFEQTCSSLHIKGMSNETLRWKLFPFSLEGKAKHWYNRIAPSKGGNWEALCASFCLDFFPISKIVYLHLEILSFIQEGDESLVAACERFDNLVHSGPSLSIPDPVLLQHFYMGLDKKTSAFLNLASRGSFLCISAAEGRELLHNISQDPSILFEAKNILEEEAQIVEPGLLPNSSQPSVVLDSNEEETPVCDSFFEFKDDYFTEFGYTSNYHSIRKPQTFKSSNPKIILDDAFLKETT
jgi:hypothetical protein